MGVGVKVRSAFVPERMPADYSRGSLCAPGHAFGKTINLYKQYHLPGPECCLFRGGALFPVLNYDLTGLMFVFGLCWGGSMGMLSLLYHRAVRVMKIK